MKKVALVGIGISPLNLWGLTNYLSCQIAVIVGTPFAQIQDAVKKIDDSIPVIDYIRLPEVLEHEDFDYVLVSDIIETPGSKGRIIQEIENCHFPMDRVLDLTSYGGIEFLSLYNILKHYEMTLRSASLGIHYQFFITGISHAFAGTDIKSYALPGFNLALTSQDLFLDYHLGKIVLDTDMSFLKFAILGVAPFSLHYDLTQSVNKHRILSYYPIIEELHNYHVRKDDLNEILRKNFLNSYKEFPAELSYPQRLGCNTQNRNIGLHDYLAIRSKMRSWDERVFDDTAKENRQILRDYCQHCLERNVLPLLIIYPVTTWYNEFFSVRIFEELRTYLHDLSEDLKIPYYDLSADSRFMDSDFFDVEHLNLVGAKKVSRLLSDILTSL